jgi:adenosylcobinamide amidohydrolase
MKIEYSPKSIVVLFPSPRKVLSSAPFAGGFRTADAIVNLRTSAQETKKRDAGEILGSFLRTSRLGGRAVGFLTSAHLEYAQFVRLQHEDTILLAIVTAGTSNALNITDRNETPYTGVAPCTSDTNVKDRDVKDRDVPGTEAADMDVPGMKPGTINIILLTNAELLDECCVSAVISATEAKSAALFDLGVRSVISGRQATGTGTDAVAVVSGGGMRYRFAGGHTVFGQLIGEAVYTGVKNSLLKRRTQTADLALACEGFA